MMEIILSRVFSKKTQKLWNCISVTIFTEHTYHQTPKALTRCLGIDVPYPNVSLLEYALAFPALCQDAHSSAMATAQVLSSFRSLLSNPGGEVFTDLPV